MQAPVKTDRERETFSRAAREGKRARLVQKEERAERKGENKNKKQKKLKEMERGDPEVEEKAAARIKTWKSEQKFCLQRDHN